MSTLKPVIIGAGPAGLTAAFELLRHGVPSVVLEADPERVGGISRTAQYKGYRFDIGGHRFFSKNPQVEQLWTEWLGDEMIKVPRLSRILYRGRFFDYPLKASNAFRNLGLIETAHCVLSWVFAQIRPRRPERSFEDWVVNRFGERLFKIFFKTYTEKVWGMPCHEISADWAAQRIKNLNLLKAGLNALGLNFSRGETIKTLIDEFRYPRLGPGMMWERLTERLEEGGCTIQLSQKVESIKWEPGRATSVSTSTQVVEGDSFFSSMPMRSLIRALDPKPPEKVLEAAENLFYRDYLTVVLILDVDELFPDNWIYIHDPGVKVGRIQNYKNWSREMVPEPGYTCLGLEYFCDVGDELWDMSDSELVELGIAELERLNLGAPNSLKDGTVVRMPKAYPVYDDAYQENVSTIRAFLEENIPNLQPIGRNGMHKYNNQDHAMWTGILAARNALGEGEYDLWRVNADAEYLEEAGATVGDGRLVPSKL
jgi:protoporphyrinogen oxidase